MPDQFEIESSDTEIVVRADEIEIATYAFRPETPAREAPKPYLYPLRFLDGGPAAVRRPWDHRWHVGLQFTWSHVDTQNFWGGPTFSRENGYQYLDNKGSMRHLEFKHEPTSGSEVLLDESLEWITSTGEHWIDEHRLHRFHSLDTERGVWAVDLTTELTNVRGSTIPLGSPTTAGRPDAGYTGWFWRGPRSWTGCELMSSDALVDQNDIMGTGASRWVAFHNQHDEQDGGGTVIAYRGTASSQDAEVPPVKWFTRTIPFAVASQSPAFDQEILLPNRGVLRLNHRFVFAAGIRDSEQVKQLAEDLAL